MGIAEECWKEVNDELYASRNELARESTFVDIIQKHIDRAVNAAREESKVQTHNLKCWPQSFNGLFNGTKRHEFRRNDRDYMLGDELVQQEWDPETEKYTGRSLRVKILYIDYGPNWDIPAGCCVMTTSEPYDKRG